MNEMRERELAERFTVRGEDRPAQPAPLVLRTQLGVDVAQHISSAYSREIQRAVYQELVRVLKLREQGCTCTPGRLRGGPATHVEDVRCPLHPLDQP
jgi:hypothetical protein